MRSIKWISLSAFLLLLTVSCAGYGPGSYTAPPPPQYDNPPPQYDNPPPQYDNPPRYSSADESIHEQVHQALDRSPELSRVNIGVRVENRNVYLSGTVYSYSQKKVAHEIAHSVDGVRHVYTNGIRVYR